MKCIVEYLDPVQGKKIRAFLDVYKIEPDKDYQSNHVYIFHRVATIDGEKVPNYIKIEVFP